QPHRVFNDRVEHRLNVCWRLADHPQDLAGGHLLFEGLLRLVEQADVLDGDDRLVGEGLKQCNLSLCKELGFGASNSDSTNGDGFPQERTAENGPVAEAARAGTGLRVFLSLRRQVQNVNRPSLDDATANDGAPLQ